MVTIIPRHPATPLLACTWRFSETFWPNLPSPCGLDADAARLLRACLTLAVEQALDKRRKPGSPLPPPCSLRRVRQQRFDPSLVQWERRDAVRALLEAEVRLMLRLVQRPLGGKLSEQWYPVVVQQCARIGCLYQALARQEGRQGAFNALALALEGAAGEREGDAEEKAGG